MHSDTYSGDIWRLHDQLRISSSDASRRDSGITAGTDRATSGGNSRPNEKLKLTGWISWETSVFYVQILFV